MSGAHEPLQPIFTAHLFPKLEGKLIELLRSLAPEDWDKQTLAPKWKVKDVAAHLLDTQIRKLAASRHGYKPENSKKLSPAKLVTLINSLNAEGVRKYSRLHPDELISRMEAASRESAEYHQALDPFGPAMFPVSWAGEEESANWFDTAREFTERWHHQQQIRLAVNQPGIMTREFYLPVLDCFLRARPTKPHSQEWLCYSTHNRNHLEDVEAYCSVSRDLHVSSGFVGCDPFCEDAPRELLWDRHLRDYFSGR